MSLQHGDRSMHDLRNYDESGDVQCRANPRYAVATKYPRALSAAQLQVQIWERARLCQDLQDHETCRLQRKAAICQGFLSSFHQLD